MKWEKGENRFLAITLLTIALFLGSALWWDSFNRMPQVTIPSPKLPSPNAFDVYNQAFLLQVARPQNLYEGYVPKGSPQSRMQPLSSPKPLNERLVFYRRKDLRAWLAQNQAALKTLRGGFALEYRRPPLRSFSAMMPDLAKAREMARTLTAESYIRAARGDWSGVANSAIDTLELGHDMPRSASLIGALVGYATQSIGRRPLRDALPHLSAAQSRAAARRLEKLYETRVPLADVYREEKWLTQASLLEIMRKGEWQKTVSELTGNISGNSFTARFRLRSKRVVMQQYTAYMDALIAEAKKPYTKATSPPQPSDEWMKQLTISNSARWNCARAETNHALLMLMLALQAYRLEKGAFPEKLDALVPAYLKAIPADPFGGGETLRYKKDGAAYKLWSIGPDGKDDGAKPIDNNPNYGKIEQPRRRWTMPDSKGDVVAGIND
jgi:hypothetical protein